MSTEILFWLLLLLYLGKQIPAYDLNSYLLCKFKGSLNKPHLWLCHWVECKHMLPLLLFVKRLFWGFSSPQLSVYYSLVISIAHILRHVATIITDVLWSRHSSLPGGGHVRPERKRWKCTTLSCSEANWSPAVILALNQSVIDGIVLLGQSRPDP